MFHCAEKRTHLAALSPEKNEHYSIPLHLKMLFFLPRAIEKTIFSFCSKYLKLFDTANIICEPGPRHVLQLTSRVIDFPLTSGSLLNAAVGNVCLTLYRCTTHWQSIQRNDKTPQSCTNPLGPREQHKATP